MASWRGPFSRLRPRNRWLARLAVLVLLVAGGVGIFIFVYRDKASVVTVEDAVDRYRSSNDATPPASAKRAEARAPTPGVYEYHTSGKEEVGILGGSSHTYPERSTISVRRTACGWSTRWDGLKERWDEDQFCKASAGAVRSPSFRRFHSFFGQSDERTFRCDDQSYVRPPVDTDRWRYSCASGGLTSNVTAEVVGEEMVEVRGRRRRCLQIRRNYVFSGDTEGEAVEELWLDSETNLLVRKTWVQDSVSDSPIGEAKYDEKYDLRLAQLEPRQ